MEQVEHNTITLQAALEGKDGYVDTIKVLEDAAKALATLSNHYQEQIKTSKTQTKREYFRKKLYKNNHELYRIMLALRVSQNRVKRAQAAEDAKNKEIPNAV